MAQPLITDDVFEEEERLFRQTVRAFFDNEVDANLRKFEEGGSGEEKALWPKAAELGLVGLCIPEQYGGPGATWVYNVILSYELGRSVGFGTIGGCITTDLAGGILVDGGAPDLIAEYAPKILAGAVQCMALTEPDAGSDVAAVRARAVRDGDDYVINAHKVYISNGPIADIIYVVASTDPSQGAKGLSMFLVDAGAEGLSRSTLKMLGFPAGSVGELNFNNVRVHKSRLIGKEGGALRLLAANLHVDRLQLAARALGQAELAFSMAVDYVKQRKIAGQSVFDFQNTQFKLAEMRSDLEAGVALVERGIRKIRVGEFTSSDAAMVKIWVSEMSARVVDTSLQLFGGVGFMDEVPISRLYRANRVFRIYGGSTELLKVALARKL